MDYSEYIEKIKDLNAEIERLTAEKDKLQRETSQYYIGKIIMESWDECYTRLGFTTKDVVDKWVNRERKKPNVYNVEVFTVDKTEYEKYYIWYLLDKMVEATDISDFLTEFPKDDAKFIKDTHIRFEEMLDDYIVYLVMGSPVYKHVLKDTDILS